MNPFDYRPACPPYLYQGDQGCSYDVQKVCQSHPIAVSSVADMKVRNEGRLFR